MMNRVVINQALRLLILLTGMLAYAQTQPMPHVEGESLASHKVILPDAAKGKVAVLVFGFTKASKGPTSAWGKTILSEFGTQTGFELYQLPVLEDVPRLIRGMVISGIKKGVPENLREHFVPIVQGETELKKLVSYREPDDAYLVVLNRDGQIVRQMHGPVSDSAFSQLKNEIQALLSH